MSNVSSIKAKLKYRAMKENRTYQEVLSIYGLERALYRVSISRYAANYILKGGMLLYAFYESSFTRGTSDVDLLGHRISNSVEVIKQSFEDIFVYLTLRMTLFLILLHWLQEGWVSSIPILV